MVRGGIEDDVWHGRSHAGYCYETHNESGAYGFTPTALQVLTRLPTIIGKTLHGGICIKVVCFYLVDSLCVALYVPCGRVAQNTQSMSQNYKEKFIYPTSVVILEEKDGVGKGCLWGRRGYGMVSIILRLSFGYPSVM